MEDGQWTVGRAAAGSQRGEVPPGYKQTEVGVIPEDWDEVPIGSVASFTSGAFIRASTLSGCSSDHSIPVYGGNGIAGYTNKVVTSEATVVIGRVGQKCGTVYLTKGPAWITDNALYPTRLLREVDLPYFAYTLQAAGLNEVRLHNDLPLVTQSVVHTTRIRLPQQTTEQRAIAAVLSDVDALLTALDRLIAKKRAVKTAAMQQLLTGRQRLPGFSGTWETKRLGEMLTVRHGRNQNSIAASGGKYPILATGGEIGRTNTALYDKPSRC